MAADKFDNQAAHRAANAEARDSSRPADGARAGLNANLAPAESVAVEPIVEPPSRNGVNRRLALCVGAAASAVGMLFWHRGELPIPRVQFGRHRTLAPAATGFLLTLDRDAKFQYAPNRRSITINANDYALVGLGSPVVGVFSLQAAWSLRSPQSRAGFFFRRRRQVEGDVLVSDMHLLEYLPLQSADAQRARLEWAHIEVRQTPQGNEKHRKVWAATEVEAPRDGERVHLGATLGAEGFPRITWRGAPLPELAWTLTAEGRQKTQISKSRLRSDYLGAMGVFVAHGAATFYQPTLTYHELS